MIPRFRAWHKPNKIMLDVIAINFSLMQITADIETRKIYPELDYWWKETDIPFSEIELMQSTGLCDKYGVEIYEGDIVKHHNDILSTVFYSTSHCACLLQDINGNRNKCQFDKLGNYSSLWIEVIGSIYKNPELLEV